MLFNASILSNKLDYLINTLPKFNNEIILQLSKYGWLFKYFNDLYYLAFNIDKEEFINYSLEKEITVSLNINQLIKVVSKYEKINIEINNDKDMIITTIKINDKQKSVFYRTKININPNVQNMDVVFYDYKTEMIMGNKKLRDIINILDIGIVNILIDENNVLNLISDKNKNNIKINAPRTFDDSIDDITNKLKILKLNNKKIKKPIETVVYNKFYDDQNQFNYTFDLSVLKNLIEILDKTEYVYIGLDEKEIKIDLMIDENNGIILTLIIKHQ